jgi:hypothetical protein
MKQIFGHCEDCEKLQKSMSEVKWIEVYYEIEKGHRCVSSQFQNVSLTFAGYRCDPDLISVEYR